MAARDKRRNDGKRAKNRSRSAAVADRDKRRNDVKGASKISTSVKVEAREMRRNPTMVKASLICSSWDARVRERARSRSKDLGEVAKNEHVECPPSPASSDKMWDRVVAVCEKPLCTKEPPLSPRTRSPSPRSPSLRLPRDHTRSPSTNAKRGGARNDNDDLDTVDWGPNDTDDSNDNKDDNGDVGTTVVTAQWLDDHAQLARGSGSQHAVPCVFRCDAGIIGFQSVTINKMFLGKANKPHEFKTVEWVNDILTSPCQVMFLQNVGKHAMQSLRQANEAIDGHHVPNTVAQPGAPRRRAKFIITSHDTLCVMVRVGVFKELVDVKHEEFRNGESGHMRMLMATALLQKAWNNIPIIRVATVVAH